MSDTESIYSEQSYNFEEEFMNNYKEMESIFEEYKVLTKSKKLSSDFDFKELIEYKNTEVYDKYISYEPPFLEILKPIEDLPLENIFLKNFYILPYTICKEAILPFLIFYLNQTDNQLFFIPYLHNKEDIMENIKVLLNISFLSSDVKFSLKGVHEFEDNYYIYVEIEKFQSTYLNNYSTTIPLVMDELYNNKFYLNKEISKFIVDYFCENIEMFVISTKNNYIEFPTVVYSSSPNRLAEFYSVFGIPKSNEIIENQYTFFSLEDLLQKQEKGNAIHRSILFCGEQFHIDFDNLEKKHLEDYDSLFIQNHPEYQFVWTGKECSQQFPLSYHLVKD